MSDKKKFLKNYWANYELDKMQASYVQYKSFIESVKDKIPFEVYEFAKAEWHYDHSDPRCPHDAWLESLEIKESVVDGNIRKRANSIKVILLGAFHDGKICVTYEGVSSYVFRKNLVSDSNNMLSTIKNGHGDWLIDEFSISDENLVIHYIEFSNGVSWEIHFQDFMFKWEPFSKLTNDKS